MSKVLHARTKGEARSQVEALAVIFLPSPNRPGWTLCGMLCQLLQILVAFDFITANLVANSLMLPKSY